jgi:retron-type reverse transcriptase
MSAENSARSVSQADGLDPVRALQRVLYRSAKQDRTRRFHALFDKLVRSDVMWRAWVDVATNQGAPGVDGVSIADIEAEGPESVRAFLDGLAADLRAGTYRPKPLRRVTIPKSGKPGETRPLGIPTIADRVIMTAAKIVNVDRDYGATCPRTRRTHAPTAPGIRCRRGRGDARRHHRGWSTGPVAREKPRGSGARRG